MFSVKEMALKRGPKALSNAELLAIMRYASPTAKQVDKCRNDLIGSSGYIRELMTADYRLSAAREMVARALEEDLQLTPLTSPTAAGDFLKARMQHLPYEVFGCLFLDNKHRVLAFEEMFRGTIDGASVHPREVVRSCLKHNAAAVILAHNHPSGVSEPSAADRAITKQLKDALAMVDVRVLDHLVIGYGAPTSFAARGLL